MSLFWCNVLEKEQKSFSSGMVKEREKKEFPLGKIWANPAAASAAQCQLANNEKCMRWPPKLAQDYQDDYHY